MSTLASAAVFVFCFCISRAQTEEIFSAPRTGTCVRQGATPPNILAPAHCFAFNEMLRRRGGESKTNALGKRQRNLSKLLHSSSLAWPGSGPFHACSALFGGVNCRDRLMSSENSKRVGNSVEDLWYVQKDGGQGRVGHVAVGQNQ